jgi:hypothetical protein
MNSQGRRAISASMSLIAVALFGVSGAHAEAPSWAIESLGANCLGATGQSASSSCEAAAMYFERSTMEAYRCMAQSVGPDQPGRVVCQRLKLPNLPRGTYAIALGQAPASGDFQQAPPQAGSTPATPQAGSTPATRVSRIRSGWNREIPAGATSMVDWAGSYWIASTDKKDIKFCLNFYTTGLDHEMCSSAIWQ